jgi:type IV pilus assembly protein PilV
MLTMQTSRRHQGGFSLIEGLVAIVIFSIGVLALIALQVTSVRQSSNAKYRSDAALLANQLIGEMWVSDRATTTLQTNFNTGGALYTQWATAVQATLPGAAASAPTVAVAADGQVTVNVFWKAPNEQLTDPVHQYTMVARIR